MNSTYSGCGRYSPEVDRADVRTASGCACGSLPDTQAYDEPVPVFLLQLRQRPDLDTFIGDFDWGVGIVRPATNGHLLQLTEREWPDHWGPGNISEQEWAYFDQHRTHLMRLVPVETFMQLAAE